MALRRLTGARDAAARIVAVPGAGASASTFAPLAAALDDSIELLAVQLPGREDRFQEQPHRSLDDVLAELRPLVAPLLDRPLILLGHSFGGIVAYSLARSLDARAPLHLAIASLSPPGVEPARRLSRLPDDELVQAIKQMSRDAGNEQPPDDLLALMLPTVRADLAVLDSAQSVSDPVECGLTVFAGAADALVPPEQLDGWRGWTRGSWNHVVLPGGHHAIFTAPEQVVAALEPRAATLAGAMRVSEGKVVGSARRAVPYRDSATARMTNGTAANAGRGAWTAYRQPTPQAAVRLFCFPYAGKGASAFRGWSDLLPSHVEVVPVQYPGREARLTEPALTTMQELVAGLEHGLGPLLDRPYALFGHSMGAVVQFEFARALRRRGLPEPVLMGVASEPAPHLLEPHPVPNDRLTEEEFLSDPDRLRPDSPLRHDETLRHLMLQTYRADSLVLEQYDFAPGDSFSCPIVAFRGSEDPHVSVEDVAAWQRHTTGELVLLEIDGAGDAVLSDGGAATICDALGDEIG